jgi:hypothetical protein
MSRSPYTVIKAEVAGTHQLRLTFKDGTSGVADFSAEKWKGIFAPLADPDYFAQVSVDPEMGTVVWPNGEDMAAEVLYEDIHSAGGTARSV